MTFACDYTCVIFLFYYFVVFWLRFLFCVLFSCCCCYLHCKYILAQICGRIRKRATVEEKRNKKNKRNTLWRLHGRVGAVRLLLVSRNIKKTAIHIFKYNTIFFIFKKPWNRSLHFFSRIFFSFSLLLLLNLFFCVWFSTTHVRHRDYCRYDLFFCFFLKQRKFLKKQQKKLF